VGVFDEVADWTVRCDISISVTKGELCRWKGERRMIETAFLLIDQLCSQVA
jgi:hypothetical protein